MPKKTKKMKAVPSTETVVIKTDFYAALTEEQYETLSRIIRWDNPIEQIDDITGTGDISNLEMGYRLGKLYSEFQETFNKLQNIIDEIEPPMDEDGGYEESYDDNYEE
jgi:hypothetical protein